MEFIIGGGLILLFILVIVGRSRRAKSGDVVASLGDDSFYDVDTGNEVAPSVEAEKGEFAVRGRQGQSEVTIAENEEKVEGDSIFPGGISSAQPSTPPPPPQAAPAPAAEPQSKTEEMPQETTSKSRQRGQRSDIAEPEKKRNFEEIHDVTTVSEQTKADRKTGRLERGVARQEDVAGAEPSIIGMADNEELKAVPISSQSETSQFSAYCPREAQADTRYGLFVYTHTPETLEVIDRDVQKFEQELGGKIPKPKTAKQSAQIKKGTAITIVPECDEIEFNPPSLTKKLDDEWVRYDFDFKAKEDLIGETLFIRVSVQIAGIEIAHIKCATEVVMASTEAVIPVTKPENPLAAAKLSSQFDIQTAHVYDKIFISYSRKDTKVASSYRLAQMAAGHDIFMDTESIHTGEDWKVALAKAIDEADIFQLFWSPNSAVSQNVRHEWDYALKYKCADDLCVGFIRPVYWKKPIPTPPEELSHLNFRFVPLQD